MKGSFTRQQWVEYTCGAAPLELRAAIEDHLWNCAECRAFSEMLEDVERELTATVSTLRESVAGLESSGQRAYEQWRLHRESPWGADYLSRRIVRLQLFLAPICGFGTAERAMLAAAGRSNADCVELLTEAQWPAFLDHLRSIVASLCGEPAARLLWHIGQPMVLELS